MGVVAIEEVVEEAEEKVVEEERSRWMCEEEEEEEGPSLEQSALPLRSLNLLLDISTIITQCIPLLLYIPQLP